MFLQLSVWFLTKKISRTFTANLVSAEKADTESSEKAAADSDSAVDTASCLQLLIDVFSQLLSPTVQPRTPLMLLNECVKSVSGMSGQCMWQV